MGVIRQLGRISGALFLVALGGMAPFSVDDRAEKGGSLIRALGRFANLEPYSVRTVSL